MDDPVPVLRTAGDSIPISGTQLDMSSVAKEIYDIVLRSEAKTVFSFGSNTTRCNII